ncbi:MULTISPECIES: DUF1345 domain-containing protein [unclassified Brevundimonas]|uniref:DUF1345 domain-containing protein n=1 Tax=unclassified Brevundimonas TaxID=2622653 RepID=UPI003F8E7DA3
MSFLRRLFRLHSALMLALIVVVAGVLLSPARWDWPLQVAAGWDAGALAFLSLTLLRIRRTRSIEAIRARAARMDQAGAAVLPLSLLAAAASVAVVVVEATGRSTHPSLSAALFSMSTIVVSWLFVQVIFALHYAHEFYGPAEADRSDRGGLMFPGDELPDYWDFLHFALVIGVAAQTADIQISGKRQRRIATLHSLMAFLFNTVIVALAVNLAVNLL